MLRRLGIDPAPGKGLVVFDPAASEGGHFQRVDPRGARSWLAKERSSGPVLVGWDAPLVAAFDQTYTERPIERLLKDRFGPAVSVRGFSGCPHWTISLDVLGRPLPASVHLEHDPRLPLRFPNDHAMGEGVVETHPAVALALLWPEDDDLPVYKPKADVSAAVARANVKRIEDYLKVCAEALFGVPWVDLPKNPTRSRPVRVERDVFAGGVGLDDLLDAQVSYLCVEAMVAQKAVCLGDPSSGYFAVPRTGKAEAWQARFDQAVAEDLRRNPDHAGGR